MKFLPPLLRCHGLEWTLLAVWSVSMLVVNPLGDFPLNDDFSYGRSVFNLVEEGRWQFDEWYGMTLAGHVLWGAVICFISGFSFTALRFSTLLSALPGLFAFFYIGKELGQPRPVAFFATLVLMFNPLFFSLSYTYMTDVPFVSALLVGLLFFIKYFKTEKNKWLAGATAMSLVAVSIRQLGLVLPLSFALLWVAAGGWRNWRGWFKGLTPLALNVVALFLYLQWTAATQGLPESYGTVSKLFQRLGNEGFAGACLGRTGLLLMTTGLFLLPLNILFLKKEKWRRGGVMAVALLLLAAAVMGSQWKGFPSGNIFYNLGLGPKLLKDGYFFINVQPALSASGLRVLALVATGGGLLLTHHLFFVFYKKRKMQKGLAAIRRFVGVNAFLYGGFLLLDVHFFDRYFLPMLVLIALLLMTLPLPVKAGRAPWAAGATALMLIGLFSLSATRDYLAWNRVRWKALHFLTREKNIPPRLIDGGFEFNGWHRPIKKRTFHTPKSWWWVDRDDYVVTFGPLNGYHTWKTWPFERCLPPGSDSLFILKKRSIK